MASKSPNKFYFHVIAASKSVMKIPPNGHFNMIYGSHNSFGEIYVAIVATAVGL